jgi:hypothetical protein
VKPGLALLLAIVGGGVVAWGATLGFAGALAGVFWIFVFGDDRWPDWTNYVLGLAALAFGLTAWAIVGRGIWLRLRGSA